jgi:hypothetical protein
MTTPVLEPWKVDPEFLKAWYLATDPFFLKLFLDDTERTITHDTKDKLVTILTFLSAHVRELNPLNNAKNASSGAGKSHGSTRIAPYFPDEFVEIITGASPTSFIHQVGVLKDAEGTPILDEEAPREPKRRFYEKGKDGQAMFEDALEVYNTQLRAWNKRLEGAYMSVEMGNKTLVFLELPSYKAIDMLLPILSHDVETFKYQITEKVGDRLRTVKVRLNGSPSVILLSVGAKYMFPLVTRCVTEGPEETPEKIKAANKLTSDDASYNIEPKDLTRMNEIRAVLRQIINAFRYGDLEVTLPFDGLYELFPSNDVRNMRLFKNLVSFIKTICALHLFQRPVMKTAVGNRVLPRVEDVLLAYELYSSMWETSKTGKRQDVTKFYYDVVTRHPLGATVKEFEEDYNSSHSQKITSSRVRTLLTELEMIDYVTTRPHPTDGRKQFYLPLIKSGQENVGIPGFSKNQTSIRLELEKRFEIWLKNVVKEEPSRKEERFFKFVNENGNVGLQEITVEELRHNVTEESRNVFVEVSQKLFSSIYISTSPTTISPTESSLKSENKAEDVKTPEANSIPTICALCDEPIDDEDRGTDFNYECIHDGEVRTRWMDEKKNVRVHQHCLADIHNQGVYGEEIAVTIEDNEKTKHKTYNVAPMPPNEFKTARDMFEAAVKSGTKRGVPPPEDEKKPS